MSGPANPSTGPSTAAPPARTKRPWGLTLAAIGCWFVGTHIVVFVPIVILYMLISLCLEEGWKDILFIRPGYLMMLMALLSIGSTAAWMLAGWAFFKRRIRRGLVHIGVALGTGFMTGVVFALL